MANSMHYWLTLRYWMHRISALLDCPLHENLAMGHHPDLPVDIWTLIMR